jgi:hypothetical protein
MSFETISLLLSWLELGLLFGILFRLAGAFDLIASTQRELRRGNPSSRRGSRRRTGH